LRWLFCVQNFFSATDFNAHPWKVWQRAHVCPSPRVQVGSVWRVDALIYGIRPELLGEVTQCVYCPLTGNHPFISRQHGRLAPSRRIAVRPANLLPCYLL
jgi:hypothetical protein